MKLTPENFWTEYAPLFKKFTPNMSKILLNSAAEYCEDEVLDLGCGVGKLWKYLNEDKVKKITGIENNEKFIEFAKDESKKMNIPISIQKQDLKKYFPKNQFSSIISLNVLYTLPSLNQHLNLIQKSLKKGGIIILSSPNKNANMNLLEKIVDKEFKGEEYELFKKYNHHLAQGFKPNLYESSYIQKIMKNHNLEILENNNNHYEKQNFFIVARKNKK